MRRSVIVGMAVLLAAAGAAPVGTAEAMPGDPAIELLAPNGGTTKANPNGVTVRFRCPDYMVSSGNPGDYSDYEVRFNRSPATDSGGYLFERWSDSSATPLGDGTCTATLKAFYDFEEDQPEEAGGRVYWQVRRDCTGCAGQYDEKSPVGTFFIDAPPIKLKLKAPRRAYPGLLAQFIVKNKSGVKAPLVLLERKKGKKWVEVDRQPLRADENEFLAKLPKGTTQVRVVALGYDGPTVGKPRGITVAAGGPRTTGRADDGAYRWAKRADRNSVLELKVAGRGTVVKNVRMSVLALCVSGPTIYQYVVAVFDRIKVAPNGSVIGVVTGSDPDDDTEWSLVGKLRNRHFTGELHVQVGLCYSDRDISMVHK